MKVQIKSEGFKFSFHIPIFILKTRMFLRLTSGKRKKTLYNVEVIKPIMPKIIKELKKFKKQNKNFVLIEVLSNDGDIVKFTL